MPLQARTRRPAGPPRRAPRRPGAVAALATLVALAGQQPAGAETSYSFPKRFTVPYLANQQGLAYADGVHHVAFDVGGGSARIVAYDDRGVELKRSPALPLGHAAEVSSRVADGNLYVAITNVSPGLKVGVVDMRPATPRLVRTYDFSHLGMSGMVAIDNARDQMVIKAGPKAGPHTFVTTDMEGRELHRFTDASQGTGQGLELVGDDLLLYTSAPDFSSNKITVYSRSGSVLRRIHVPVADEGEGLSVDRRTGQVHLGFRGHDVRAMSPAYSPVHPLPVLTPEQLANGGQDLGTGGTGNGVAVPLPAWAVTGGMTAIRYGACTGCPSATSPGPADRGGAFFSGGTVATSTMTQVLSTADRAGAVDAGAVAFELSGWLGGYRTQDDAVTVVATFRDAAGTALRSTRIGPVTAAHRAGVTGMLHRSATGTVPVGTRSVRVVVTATRAGGTNNDGYADSLRLTLR